jgi:hypothetical protein
MLRRAPRLGPLLATVIFCVFASNMAVAGSITVDNRSSPLTAFAQDFSSQTILADDATHKVTFTGLYKNTGGFPSLNDSVSYLIALGSPPSAPLFGSVLLTITGITDASGDNTQVDMIFNGVVTGPIQPDFTVPDPGTSFDVAAFLRQQNAASVPTDLAVVILSAVPEPASLVLGAIAAVAGISVGLRRRALA